MTKKNLIYLGGGREVIETLSKAKDLPLRIIYGQKSELFKKDVSEWVHEVHLLDYADISQLLEWGQRLAQHQKIDGVLSLSEDALVPAAHLADALGVPAPSVITVELLKNKLRMREFLKQNHLSPVQFQVGRTEKDIYNFLQTVGGPIILKPLDGAGSFGIFKLSSPTDIDSIYQRLTDLNVSPFLMEEYLEGPEISVETFSFNGHTLILAITDKLIQAHHVEMGHTMPSHLSQELKNEVAQFTKTFLKTINLNDGPAHTEIKITKNGLRLIESHNRPGGDRINELVNHITGFDMKKMALVWSCRACAPIVDEPASQGGVAIQFLEIPPGHLTKISGIDTAKSSAGVLSLTLSAKIGQSIKPIKESYDRLGYIIAEGRTALEARRNAELAASRVEFEVQLKGNDL